MNYLLDTNVVIGLLNNRPTIVRERFRQALSRRSSIAVSSIVLFELRYGAARSQQPSDNNNRIRAFLSGSIEVLPFGDDDAAKAGALRAVLESRGTPIGPYDLLIAAQALRRADILVTANFAEFSHVPDLKLQDWTKP